MADISKEDLRKEITAILKDADLASTSAKKVRTQLEKKLNANLLTRKAEIDSLVMEIVNSKESNNKKKAKKAVSDEEEEGEEEEEEEEEAGDDDEEASEDDKKGSKRASTGAAKKPPAAKKAKKSSESEASEPSEEGESEEEYSPKKSKPPKTRKLPPKKKKGSDSGSDEDWAKTQKGPKKGGGGKRGGSGYTKSLTLSPELAALVGEPSMPRHEVVKKVWAIIKEKNLYDPKNKQYAICDDALFKVVGVKRFRTFGMMKYLKDHFIS